MRQTDLHERSWRTGYVRTEGLQISGKSTQSRRRRLDSRAAPQRVVAVGPSVGVIDLSSKLTHYQEVLSS